MAEGSLGLYIHIPFCVCKCRYCDFLSFPARGGEADAYVDTLVSEIGRLPGERPVTSVFVGGGTPAILPPGAAGRILSAVQDRLALAPGAEITIEANPGTLTEEKLAEYRAAGCNRLSIGAQSTNDGQLRRIGRIHRSADVFEAIALARRAGFANINVDLMRGLPGQSVDDHLDSLRAVAGQGVEHMSVYSLILEEGTLLFDDVQSGKETAPSQDEEYEMEKLGIDLLKSYGYERYEVSNYAKAAMRCRHNENYWLCGEYLAAGLGASGALREGGRLIRRRNHPDMAAYLDAVGRGIPPVAEETAVSWDEEMFEVVMLGLRLVEGVNLAAFSERFGQSLQSRFGDAVAQGSRDGLLAARDGFLRLTERGMEIQNQVLLLFMER